MIIPGRKIRVRLLYDNSATPPIVLKPWIDGDTNEKMSEKISSAPSTVTAIFTVTVRGAENARETKRFSGSVPGAEKFIEWLNWCIKEHVV